MAATTVDTLLVRIEADMSDIKRDLKRLERSTSESTSKMQKSFGRLAKSAGPLLGAALVAGTAVGSKAVISLASDIEEMQAKSDVVFGSFAGQVREDLAQFADEVGRSRFELEGMAASVQDTFVPMGIARGEAADLSVQLAKLATDVASFNNAADADVMNAFQSALVGNHETVRRFGIVITEVELKQELLRMGINKASKDVDQATKIQARLNLIMAGTTDAQGDAARTSGSFANQSKALKASLEILGSEIGNVLLPKATDLITTFNTLTKSFTEFLRRMKIINTAPMQRLAEITAEVAIEQEKYNKAWSQNSPLARRAEKNIEVLIAERDAILATLHGNALLEAGRAKAQSANDLQAESQKEVNKKLTEGEKFLQNYNNELELLTKQLEGHGPASLTFMLAEAEQKLGDEFEALKPQLEVVFQAMIEGNKILETMNKTTEVSNEEFEEFEENLTATQQALIDYKAEVGAAQLASMEFEGSLGSILEFLQEFPDATAAQVEEFKKFAELMESLPEKTKETEDALDGIKEMTQTFNNAVQTASKGISDSFADMLMSGKLNMESLKGVFDNMVKTIISKAFELMVVNRIMNGIFGGVTGFETLPTMGGGGLGGAAGGGSISAPTLVGERGPELFVPHSAGVIKNAHDTRGMMGGSPVVVNQNLNIETGVAQTVRAEILTMMPMIQNSTLSAVQNARQRGGSFAASFGG